MKNRKLNASKNSLGPLVSVGLPVYNGEKLVGAAIEAILAQTHQNLELIISDNASSDGTSAICEHYAATDHRVVYVRQRKNYGATMNFRFVLERARGKYFFWNACDDIRSPEFVAVNVSFLEANPDYCASVSKARDEGGKFDQRKMGDRPLDQESYEGRILAYFKGWHRNSIFNSVYRREVLVDNPILYGPEYLAHDWAIVMHVAKTGKFQRLDEGELVLGKGGMSKGIHYLRNMRRRQVERFFPHWEIAAFVMKISKDFSLLSRIRLLYRAALLNLMANLLRLIHVFES